MKFKIIFRRAIAYLIDSVLVYLIFVWITQTYIFLPLRHLIIGPDDWFVSGWLTEAYTLLTISLPTWLYFALTERLPWRGTLGKRLMKLQTLDIYTRGRLNLTQAILRTLIKLLPWEITHLTINIPTPMWHDPDPGFRFGFVLVPILFVVYMIVIIVNQNGQGPHDLVVKSIVVNTE